MAERCMISGVPASKIHVVHPGITFHWIQVNRSAGGERANSAACSSSAGTSRPRAANRLRRVYQPSTFGAQLRLTIAGPKTWPLRDPPTDGIDFLGRSALNGIQHLYVRMICLLCLRDLKGLASHSSRA